MDVKQIVFTKVNTAELLDTTIADELGEYEVLVKTNYSTISCGTEKANISGSTTVSWVSEATTAIFPRYAGYSSSGIVEKVGSKVTKVAPGDSVAMIWSQHKSHNILHENGVVKFDPDKVDMQSAAICHIGTFPLAAIRKTKLEIGESALVMGLGILGLIAVKQLKVAGATPIIAADPVEGRRKLALESGADYAFDPTEEGFAKKVKEVTTGGVNVCIEVSGVGNGLNGALDCMQRFGRVALLGCTRDSHFEVDYYRKIHGPGITLVGAHTQARASAESSHGNYTAADDIRVQFKLLHMNRLCYTDIIHEVHNPQDCTEVYNRLVTDKNFPVCVQYKWDNI